MMQAGKMFTMLQTPHIDDKTILLPHPSILQAAFEQKTFAACGA